MANHSIFTRFMLEEKNNFEEYIAKKGYSK